MVIAAALGVAPLYLLTDMSDKAGRHLAITPKIAMGPRPARAWMAGVGSPPGDEDLRFYMLERPESELQELHAQWVGAAEALREGHGADVEVLDPRVVDEDAVARIPALPADDRRKSSRRSNR